MTDEPKTKTMTVSIPSSKCEPVDDKTCVNVPSVECKEKTFQVKQVVDQYWSKVCGVICEITR